MDAYSWFLNAEKYFLFSWITLTNEMEVLAFILDEN